MKKKKKWSVIIPLYQLKMGCSEERMTKNM